jgi:hypothetical protein
MKEGLNKIVNVSHYTLHEVRRVLLGMILD